MLSSISKVFSWTSSGGICVLLNTDVNCDVKQPIQLNEHKIHKVLTIIEHSCCYSIFSSSLRGQKCYFFFCLMDSINITSRQKHRKNKNMYPVY